MTVAEDKSQPSYTIVKSVQIKTKACPGFFSLYYKIVDKKKKKCMLHFRLRQTHKRYKIHKDRHYLDMLQFTHRLALD